MVKVSELVAVVQDMARQGGGTLDVATGKAATLTDGYYVGGAEGWKPFILAAREDAYVGRDMIEALTGAVAVMRERVQGSGYLGVWEHNGALYLDATDWHATEWEALEAGKARGEMAVWDIAKETEIAC